MDRNDQSTFTHTKIVLHSIWLGDKCFLSGSILLALIPFVKQLVTNYNPI